MRQAHIVRQTAETSIDLQLTLEGKGSFTGSTGVGFFDHMLRAFSVHAGMDLTLQVRGDLEVDCHHTVEDVGIVLGNALREALGDRSGICRFGECRIPMDEAMSSCVMDISGRAFLVYECDYTAPAVGDLDTQMVEEFFRAVAFNAGITLHLHTPYGENDHHKIESQFKAFAHALRRAVTVREGGVLSSKGVL
ncbi:MAG: imidazoleglycerol-phosphate dehydratase HisB [Clostridia bacterium]|nr:imidazoleglycerol-phosphate dehydratase HisB [Clostridia bacterium]